MPECKVRLLAGIATAARDSLYRVVVQRCPSCREAEVHSADGPVAIDAASADLIECDAKRVVPGDDGGKHHADPTPPALRQRVLARREPAHPEPRACICLRPLPPQLAPRGGVLVSAQGILQLPVVTDEAINLARRFGGQNSPQFVNGVLDGVYRRLKDEGLVSD